MPIKTFTILFISTQNKQQHGTKVICSEIREKSYGKQKFDIKKSFVFSGPLVSPKMMFAEIETKILLLRGMLLMV